MYCIEFCMHKKKIGILKNTFKQKKSPAETNENGNICCCLLELVKQ